MSRAESAEASPGAGGSVAARAAAARVWGAESGMLGDEEAEAGQKCILLSKSITFSRKKTNSVEATTANANWPGDMH